RPLDERVAEIELEDSVVRYVRRAQHAHGQTENDGEHDRSADRREQTLHEPPHVLHPATSASSTPGAASAAKVCVAPAARNDVASQPLVDTPMQVAPMPRAAAASRGVSPITTTRQASSPVPRRAAPRVAPMRSSSTRSSWSQPKPPNGKCASSPPCASLSRAPSRRLPVPSPTAAS